MLARSPTVQGLAETLAAIPPVNPQQQDTISHAPFTPAQRAAGVPCAAMQETAARSYLVRAAAGVACITGLLMSHAGRTLMSSMLRSQHSSLHLPSPEMSAILLYIAA